MAPVRPTFTRDNDGATARNWTFVISSGSTVSLAVLPERLLPQLRRCFQGVHPGVHKCNRPALEKNFMEDVRDSSETSSGTV